MKKFVGKFVSVAPFVMLGVTFICAVLSSLEMYSSIYSYLPDLLGYSIFTNVVFLYHYSFKKYCNPTRLSVWGLFVMNLVSIVTLDTEYYNVLNDIYISLIVLIVIIVFKVKRW